MEKPAETPSNPQSRLRVVLSSVWKFFAHLAKEFVDKGCQKSAAALTYVTLFALVPLMTVTYSMFSFFPAFGSSIADQLQTWIFQSFIPETGTEVQGYLADFSEQARNLTWFGAAMLIVTAYLMLTNIERTFNAIWGVERARKGLFSFLLYWAVLTIGPLLLGAGMVVSAYFMSLKLVINELGQLGMGLDTLFFKGLSWLMTSAAFTLLFVAVPNCKVPIKYAFIGGFTTAILFELVKAVFGLLVANSSFQLIYGAFAVVPLFLLWINILWTIILGGAVLVRALAEKGLVIGGDQMPDHQALVACLALFRERAQLGKTVDDQDCVSLGIGLAHWQKLRFNLVRNNWIAVTESGDYVLCRDLRQITLWDVAKITQMRFDEALPVREKCSSVNALNEVKEKEHVQNVEQQWLDTLLQRQDSVSNYAKTHFSMTLEELYTNQKA